MKKNLKLQETFNTNIKNQETKPTKTEKYSNNKQHKSSQLTNSLFGRFKCYYLINCLRVILGLIIVMK